MHAGSDVDAAPAVLDTRVCGARRTEDARPYERKPGVLAALPCPRGDRGHHGRCARSETELPPRLIQEIAHVHFGCSFGAKRGSNFRRRSRCPPRAVGHRVAVDGDDDRRRPIEHSVRPREERLAGRAHFHCFASRFRPRSGRAGDVPSMFRPRSGEAGDVLSIRAPSPGRASRMRSTPGTPSSACLTRGASSRVASTLTCGPASMLAKAAVPSSRSARTAAMTPQRRAVPVENARRDGARVHGERARLGQLADSPEVPGSSASRSLRVEPRRLVEPRARVGAALHGGLHSLGGAHELLRLRRDADEDARAGDDPLPRRDEQRGTRRRCLRVARLRARRSRRRGFARRSRSSGARGRSPAPRPSRGPPRARPQGPAPRSRRRSRRGRSRSGSRCAT